MKRRDAGTVHQGVRLPVDTLERVERYHARLSATLPAGLDLARADVLRALIVAGLDALEGKPPAAVTPRRPRKG